MEANTVRVGDGQEVDPITELPMYRKYLTFEANREQKFIQVFYKEWLESNGSKLNIKDKKYILKNIPAEGHIETTGDGDVFIEDVAGIPMFDLWLLRPVEAKADGLYINNIKIVGLDIPLKFGEDIIIGAIDATLNRLPFDAKDNYIVTP